jgi:hypothetical protein
MDKKTQNERARNKALRARPGGFSSNLIEARGMATKGQIGKFPNRRCDYVIGGEEILIRKKRKTKKIGQSDTYFIPMVVGGRRCSNNELAKGRCLEHLASTYEKKKD